MTLKEVMTELEQYGNQATKNVFLKHGAKEPFFGVKVGDMKKIQKKIKTDHPLALELYATGNSDAMYLAGLIADAGQVTKKELNDWVKKASWYMISEYTVPWLAADSPHGEALGLQWIDSKDEMIASAGWSALSSWISVRDNEEINTARYEKLLDRVQKEIHDSANRVRYTMNGFVIAVGSFIPELTAKAKEVAVAIGKVDVEMGGTACKVPPAKIYIEKVESKGRIGNKRKMARC